MSSEPHIIHVFSSAGLYGAEHAVLGLMPALAGMGISGTLACIDNPHLGEQLLYQRARALGIPAVRIPCTGRLDNATTRALAALLASLPNAILHVHGYKGAFYALRARRACPGTPLVATLHGWVTNTRALWWYRLLELWMLRRMEQVCIVAEDMRQPLLESGIQPTKIRLIGNGIDTDRFRPDAPALSRNELGIPNAAFVFGAVQRLSSEKNPLGLLEAFARVAADAPHAWLVVAGDGPQRDTFVQRAHELEVMDRVLLLGSRDDPERLYALFDCYVLASLTEGLPLALLEAMASERQVIASAVGQIPTVLQGLPARTVPAGNTGMLVEAMRAALGSHPSLADMRKRVLNTYSITRMASDYAGLYRELGGHHASRAA